MVYNEPILIIDGVRAIGAQASGLASATLPSRLDDLDPNVIERVEVLRGIAAAALYGVGASKGVIIVTTKRARRDGPRWEAYAEGGTMADPVSYPANFGTLGRDASGFNDVDNCPLLAQTTSSCTAVAQESWNPIETVSPFRTGSRQSGGLSFANGFGGWQFGAGVGVQRAKGVRSANRLETTSARANISGTLASDLSLDVTALYRDGLVDQPDDHDALLQAGLLGRSRDDPETRGYEMEFVPNYLSRTRYQSVSRLATRARIAWQPIGWLEGSVVAGLDRARSRDLDVSRQPWQEETVVRDDEVAERGKLSTMAVEADLTGSYSLGWSITGQTSAGVSYWKENAPFDGRASSVIVDLNDPDSPDSQLATHRSWWMQMKTRAMGPFLRQQLGWSDRVFLGGSIRRDKLEDFFPTATTVTSYSVDASWRALGDMRSPGGDGLRLRAAYGKGGDLSFAPTLADLTSPSGGLVDRTVERSTELEMGADVMMFEGRAGFDVTHYRGRVRSGVTRSILASYTGFEEMTVSDADVRTRGIETSVFGNILAGRTLAWALALSAAFHEQTLLKSTRRYLSDGDAPLGQYWAQPFAYADTDFDGLIGQDEVQISVNSQPFGSPIPKREIALRSAATIFGALRLGTVVEHRGGHQRLNTLRQWRCGEVKPVCVEAHDPSTSMFDQATVVSRYETSAGFIEDADFTRLREVSLSASLPARWAKLSGATSARISIVGHNLATWTSYRGLDPEIHPTDSLQPNDAFVQPLLRTFTARLDLAW
jgi:TonB-dependent SusC/RagA subfamily outer membrane receptor